MSLDMKIKICNNIIIYKIFRYTLEKDLRYTHREVSICATKKIHVYQMQCLQRTQRNIWKDDQVSMKKMS